MRKLSWKNTEASDDILIGKKTSEVLRPEVDDTRKFYVDFIVFIHHKTTSCMVEVPHILNSVENGYLNYLPFL